MPAAAVKAAPSKFQMIAIEKLHESIFNPRKTFEDDAGELVGSVRSIGILQALTVRPMKAVDRVIPGEFEIVCGHRRHRAAKEAGLTEVPCVVLELTDEQAIEAGLIENAARKGVPALEEADALQRLVKQYGYTVTGLSAKLGKSEATIRSRLKLVTLGPDARKALEEKRIEPQLGMLIAIRVPNQKLQPQALKEILTGGEDGAPMSYRAASEYLRRHFMLEIKETGGPFDPADTTLCPSAGSCYGCPKRSDSQPDLFAQTKKNEPPLCLDPLCFKEKEDAAWNRKKAAAQREGKDVLSEKRAKELFPSWSPNELAYNAPFRELDSRCYEDPKNRTLRQLLPKDARTALVRDPAGKVHELIAADRVAELLKEAGHDFSRKREATNPYSAEERQKLKEAKQRDETGRRALAAIVERHSSGAVSKDHDQLWRFMFERVLALSGLEAIIVAAKRRGIVEKQDREAAEKGLEKLAAELEGRELEALVIELSIAGHAKHSTWGGGYSDQLKEVCEAYGVDLKKLDAQTKADAKNPKKLPVCKGYQRADGVRVKTCTTRVPTDGPGACTKCQKLQAKEDAKAKKGAAA